MDETAGECSLGVVRGKRSRRQRLRVAGPFIGGDAAVSSTSSGQFSGSTVATEEEEDMVNCLMLLARGSPAESHVSKSEPNIIVEEGNAAVKMTSRRFSEAFTTTNGKAGFYVYECKTCSKCFSSFQALGGHRASHKKPKQSIPPPCPMPVESKAAEIYDDCIRRGMTSVGTAQLLAASETRGGNGKQRIHQCSICGAEFMSGQALGGHMRRHRPTNHQEPPQPPTAKKVGSRISLDLNLPAPSEEDDDCSNGIFPKSSSDSTGTTPPFSYPKKPRLLLSTSSLVDCHY